MKKKTPDKKLPAQQAELWYRRAIASYRKNDMEGARQSCRKAAALNPRNVEHWYGLGAICQELKDNEQAARAYGKIVKLKPGDDWSWNMLGFVLLDLKNPQEAEKALREAVRLKPDDDNYWSNLALACRDQKNYRDAAGCYFQAATLKPEEPGYWQLLGDSFLDMGKNPEAAEAYRRAVQLKPRDHISWHNLAVALDDNGDAQGALQAYREAANLKPRNSFYQEDLAGAYSELGHLDLALKIYRKAVRLKPDNTTCLMDFGDACENAGRYGEASRAFRRAAQVNLKKYPAPARLDASKTGHSKPRVFSATVDLKLTPEGKIKVCEFNDLWLSGFDGFKCVTGKDMIEDIVRPFYDSLPQKWQSQGLPVEKIEHRNEEDEQDLLGFFSAAGKKRRRAVVANADPGFQALCIYKDYLPAILPDNLRECAPRTYVVPLSRPNLAAQSRGEDGAKLMVVKPSDALQGKGVEILPAGQLPGRVDEIAALYKGEANDNTQYWASNIHPNIIVQDCEHSAPVPAQDGLLYDGTMRVAFTAVFNPGNAAPEISFHGAYWKLPAQPCADGGRESIVSFSPAAHLTGNTEEAFSKKPFAAAVSEEHRITTESQLQGFLTALLPIAVAPPRQFLGKVLGMMDSYREWVRALGTRLATEHGLGNVLAKEAGTDASARLVEKMNINRREHAGDGAALYLKQIFSAPRNPRNGRESQLLFDVAEYMKKGCAARDLKQLALAL